MDARPQRLGRAFRVQTDENIAPPTKQSIHQRHKSTSTLSSSNMIGLNGIKAGALKRTAFGDVSNTVRNLSQAQDDIILNGKPNQVQLVKPVVVQDKPAAFLRPAQRPLSVAAIKGPLNTIIAVSEANSSSAQANGTKSQSLDIKRALSKKATQIYSDADQENVQPAQDHNNQLPAPSVASVAPVHQNLGPRQQKSNIQLKQELPSLRQVQSKRQLVDTSDLQEKSDPIYQDAPETITDSYEEYTKVVAEAEAVNMEQDPVVQRHLPALPVASEPEEYWEDEEEEIYDEQGYTTAHSHRSRGDNTTGGATTVLAAPKVTKRVEKELAEAKILVESTRTAEEIEDELWDTSMVAEYGDEIFGYMRELEIKMQPNANYMDLQTEIQWSMRSVLMDWLIQVHHRFSLLPETLFLCVNYIDRFLSCKIVSLGKLQLVGATAIFVAAKYEEINCPSVSEIVYMVDGGYTVDEILKAERFMLTMLQFELGWPGPMSFLRRISKADDYDLETRTLAKYFLEVTIMDERFVGTPPSYIAAGAHCLARLMLKKGEWTQAHVYYSGYTWSQVRPLVSMILECCGDPQKHHSAVFEKYQDRRYKRAALFVQGEVGKGFTLPALKFARPSLPSTEDFSANMQFERESFKQLVV